MCCCSYIKRSRYRTDVHSPHGDKQDPKRILHIHLLVFVGLGEASLKCASSPPASDECYGWESYGGVLHPPAHIKQ